MEHNLANQQQQAPLQQGAAAVDARYLAENIRRYLEKLKPYQGDKRGLAPFIRAIEKITPLMTNLDLLDAALRFEQILSKLEGKAANILSEYPENWPQVRALLIRSFVDKRDIGDLLIDLERIQFRGSIQDTFSVIQTALTDILNKIELSPVDALCEERISSIKNRAFIHFRNILPEPCISAIVGRGDVCDIYRAIELLDEHKLMHLTYDRPRFSRNSGYNNNNYNNTPRNNNSNQNSFRNKENSNNNTGFSQNTNQTQNKTPFNNYNSNSNNNNNNNHFSNPRQNYRQPFPQQYNSRQPNQQNPNRGHGNNSGNNSGNSRQTSSGLNRVHEPMETENFHILASEDSDPDYRSFE